MDDRVQLCGEMERPGPAAVARSAMMKVTGTGSFFFFFFAGVILRAMNSFFQILKYPVLCVSGPTVFCVATHSGLAFLYEL